MFIQPLILNPHGSQVMFTSPPDNTVRAVDQVEQSQRNLRIQSDPSSIHHLNEPSQTPATPSTQPPDVIDFSAEALAAAETLKTREFQGETTENERSTSKIQAPIGPLDPSSTEQPFEPLAVIDIYKKIAAPPVSTPRLSAYV